MMEDIFEVQEQVALEIAEALKIKLTLEERSSVGQQMTANMEAYERFVRAEEAMIKIACGISASRTSSEGSSGA
jgi:hypothetical protein